MQTSVEENVKFSVGRGPELSIFVNEITHCKFFPIKI